MRLRGFSIRLFAIGGISFSCFYSVILHVVSSPFEKEFNKTYVLVIKSIGVKAF